MNNKPEVKLICRDGNAFAIIGACRRAAKAAGWDDVKIKAVTDEMTAGDYNQLLQTAMKYFEVK